MADPTDKERLEALEQRIKAAKGETATLPAQEQHYTQAQVAWRMVTELVVGLGMGLGIGMGLDALLGTSPVLLIVFVFLGFAAGVRVMLQTAKEVQQGNGADAAHGQDEGS